MGRDPVRLRRAAPRCSAFGRGHHCLVPRPPRRLQMPALRGVYRIAEDLDRQNPEIQAAGNGAANVNPARQPPGAPDLSSLVGLRPFRSSPSGVKLMNADACLALETSDFVLHVQLATL